MDCQYVPDEQEVSQELWKKIQQGWKQMNKDQMAIKILMDIKGKRGKLCMWENQI